VIRIAIAPAAYAAIAETLKARCLPGPGESVSDVILRLAGAGAVSYFKRPSQPHLGELTLRASGDGRTQAQANQTTAFPCGPSLLLLLRRNGRDDDHRPCPKSGFLCESQLA
jgi:hypothetical protein